MKKLAVVVIVIVAGATVALRRARAQENLAFPEAPGLTRPFSAPGAAWGHQPMMGRPGVPQAPPVGAFGRGRFGRQGLGRHRMLGAGRQGMQGLGRGRRHRMPGVTGQGRAQFAPQWGGVGQRRPRPGLQGRGQAGGRLLGMMGQARPGLRALIQARRRGVQGQQGPRQFGAGRQRDVARMGKRGLQGPGQARKQRRGMMGQARPGLRALIQARRRGVQGQQGPRQFGARGQAPKGARQQVGAEGIRQTIGLLRQLHPEEARELARLRQADPEQFRAKVGELTRKLTDEYVPKAVEYLKHFEPEKAKRLEELKRKHPEAARAKLLETVGKVVQFEQLRKHDPEQAELLLRQVQLNRETAEIANGYHQAGPDEKAEVKEHLTDVLNELFDVKTELLEHEAGRLRDRIAQLEESIATRRERKADLVQERLSHLTGTAEAYAW